MKTLKHINALFISSFIFSFNPILADWTPPVTLSPSVAQHDANTPQIIVDTDGNSIVTWSRFNESNPSIIAFESSTKTLNRDWKPATSNFNPDEDVESVQFKVDGAGNAIAVWTASIYTQGVMFIRGATLQAGSNTWVPTDPISDQSLQSFMPQIAVNPSGRAAAVWVTSDMQKFAIQGATLDPGSNTWTPTNDLTKFTKNFIYNPQIGMDEAGNVVAAWMCFVNDAYIIQAATMMAGTNTWVQTNDVAPTDDNDGLQIAFNNAGKIILVWSGGTTIHTLKGATLTLGNNTWIPTSNLSEDGIDTFAPSVAINASGFGVAVWQSAIDNHTVIQAATLPIDSTTWNATKTLSDPTIDAFYPSVGIDGSGDAVAVWQHTEDSDPSISVIQCAILAFGKTEWIPTDDLTPADQNAVHPLISINNAGNATAIWNFFDGQVFVVQASTNILVNESINSVIVATPIVVPGDGVTSSTITVTLLDVNHQPIVGHDVSLQSDSLTTAISAPSGPSDVNGQVIFTATNTVSEIVTYTAKDMTNIRALNNSNGNNPHNLGINQTANVKFTPITNASNSTVVASPSSIPANGTTTSTITVTLLDSSLQPVPDQIVTLSAANGNSTISAASGPSDVNGQVKFTVTDTRIEQVTYRATTVVGKDILTLNQTALVNFTKVQPLQPAFFNGKVVKNKFATHSEITHQLQWGTPPANPGYPEIVTYQLYQNGFLIYTTPATGALEFIAHNRAKKTTYTYALVGLARDGSVTTPLQVVLD